jgi:ankyrin repeat protein
VDVNAVNDRRDTAVHGAATRGADRIIQFLADHGAKLDVRNKSGRTPMDLALGIGGVANTGGLIRTSTATLLGRLIEAQHAQSTAQR